MDKEEDILCLGYIYMRTLVNEDERQEVKYPARSEEKPKYHVIVNLSKRQRHSTIHARNHAFSWQLD